MRKIEADTFRIPDSAKWDKRGTLLARHPNSERWNEFEFCSFHVAVRVENWIPGAIGIQFEVRGCPRALSHILIFSFWSPNSVRNFACSQCDRFLSCVFTSKLPFSWHWWIQSLSFYFQVLKTLSWILEPWHIGTRSYSLVFLCTRLLIEDGQEKNLSREFAELRKMRFSLFMEES